MTLAHNDDRAVPGRAEVERLLAERGDQLMRVPRGFRRVPDPRWLIPGMSIVPTPNQPQPTPLRSRVPLPSP